jgi:predicted TPR repeat methyltransferase
MNLPNDAPLQALSLEARELARAGRGHEAARLWHRALTIEPCFYPSPLHQARMLEREGRLRKAARVFGEVLKIMPERAVADPALQHAVQHPAGAPVAQWTATSYASSWHLTSATRRSRPPNATCSVVS